MGIDRSGPDDLTIIGVHARISENTPRDLCGVETLTRLASSIFGVVPHMLEGRLQPFGRTPWQEDLNASRQMLTDAATYLAEALTNGASPTLTFATDCALALATLPVVAQVRPPARVLWLDAHCDFDTPETTTIGFLGCMSLAGACGFWESGFVPAFPASKVVLCGTRPAPGDFDTVAQQLAEASEVTMVDISKATIADVLMALDGAPVYLHLDPDVLDPSVNPIPYARPGGLSAAALYSLLSAVVQHNPIVGVELTAFHAPDDSTRRDGLAELLLNAVIPMLTRPR